MTVFIVLMMLHLNMSPWALLSLLWISSELKEHRSVVCFITKLGMISISYCDAVYKTIIASDCIF